MAPLTAWTRRGLPALVATAIMLAQASTADAQARPSDVQVKAAYLSKFAAYVNWPPSMMGRSDAPLTICIVGRDPFGDSLDMAASGQRVDQHPIVIRRLDDAKAAGACHIAFVGGSSRQSAAAMLMILAGQPVLTITDGSLGTGRGMVHFAVKDGRVRFHIDDALAARNNLSISARLLSLALSVKQRAKLS